MIQARDYGQVRLASDESPHWPSFRPDANAPPLHCNLPRLKPDAPAHREPIMAEGGALLFTGEPGAGKTVILDAAAEGPSRGTSQCFVRQCFVIRAGNQKRFVRRIPGSLQRMEQ